MKIPNPFCLLTKWFEARTAEADARVKRAAKAGCQHRWKKVSEGKITHGNRHTGDHIILVCKICGDYKDHVFDITK